MKKTMKSAFIILFMLSHAFCSTTQNQEADDISFAIIANTFSSSPYSEPDAKYANLISDVNSSGVSFTIHMGNMIYSGPAEKSLNNYDIYKQLKDQKKFTSSLFSRFYHVTGEYDIYIKNPELFKEEFGPDYYSFNYGNTHFIVLNSNDTKVNFISENQFAWLRKDFKNHHNYARFIIFLNHIPKLPPDDKHFRNYKTLKQNTELLDILKQHDKNIIISNYGNMYFEFSDGDGTYINTVISNLSDYTRRSENDYYIISTKEGIIQIEGRKLGK